MSIIREYHEAVRFMESFSNTSLRKNTGRGKKDPSFFIERTRYFLRLLGNPENGFSYIHVTGTAGKGTVSTMLQEVLVASGKKAGLFTSPYVTTTIEKIRIDERYIGPQDLVRLVDYIKPFIEKAKKGPYGAPSAFEQIFAIALLYFKEQRCEWIVLEVGFGGCYDATNVIRDPAVTVVTNIDYDHTEILGKTLWEIATDKAGIIKPGSTFFTSEQRPHLQKIFRKICREMSVDFHSIARQAHYSSYNTELVRAVSRSLGISEGDIDRGIQNTRLPCRFELMQEYPHVILDGAHNRAKIRSTISNIERQHFRKLYVILAIADNKKDHQAIVEPLLAMPYTMHIILTQVRTGERRSISTKLLLSVAQKYKRKNTTLQVIEDALAALGHVLKIAKKGDLVLVTGSFFLAGELRKKWISEKWMLEHGRAFDA